MRPIITLAGVLSLALALNSAATTDPVAAFSGQAAFSYTKHLVSFGEREPGSRGHARAEQYIESHLKSAGANLELDHYTASTPIGPINEVNIIAKYGPANGDRIVMLAGHYDTIFMKGFVGANDGGASAGILLAFADVLAHAELKSPVWLLFLDGEEAVKTWSDTDSRYGSKHLAQKFVAEAMVPKIRGILLLDMIGDKDLDIARETNSTRWLQDFVSSAAGKLGYDNYFFKQQTNIQDDHLSFLAVGIPTVDLGDFTYGAVSPRTDFFGAYHHTLQDTMDKISPRSFTIVGKVVLQTVRMLQ